MKGVGIEGICACVPARCVANDANIAQATGILQRRIADPGVTGLDLCLKAARRVMADTQTRAAEIGAVIGVSFTQHRRMPCNAVQAQAALGLGNDVLAYDVMLACSGYGYGLHLAGLLARETGRKVLLLDGDKQSDFLRADDGATVPLLSDGGTATLVAPCEGAADWEFAFFSDGAKGEALKLERDGTIEMDGFGVFRFVASDVVALLKDFIRAHGLSGSNGFDHFVPHQANVYMIRQLAKSAGIDESKLRVSADTLGNLSSASVPATIAHCRAVGRVLLVGFGGGLSVSIARVDLPTDCKLSVIDG